MTLTEHVTKGIVRKLIMGEDYRREIVGLINAKFLQFAVDFFKKVAIAKLDNQDIDVDWYKKEMLNNDLPSDEIIINSGLNKKTITNMYNSARREIVIDASNSHYDALYEAINALTQIEDLDLTLKIEFNKVSVELNINESLIVINTLAVKRSALRGGSWSTAGKQVEGPLMESLCKLYQVPPKHYSKKFKARKLKKGEVNREVDFYLTEGESVHKCEVKLMGKGNPESADVAMARRSKVFIADKLSNQGKTQLNELGTLWLELRGERGCSKFYEILQELSIPSVNFDGDLEKKLDEILGV